MGGPNMLIGMKEESGQSSDHLINTDHIESINKSGEYGLSTGPAVYTIEFYPAYYEETPYVWKFETARERDEVFNQIEVYFQAQRFPISRAEWASKFNKSVSDQLGLK